MDIFACRMAISELAQYSIAGREQRGFSPHWSSPPIGLKHTLSPLFASAFGQVVGFDALLRRLAFHRLPQPVLADQPQQKLGQGGVIGLVAPQDLNP